MRKWMWVAGFTWVIALPATGAAAAFKLESPTFKAGATLSEAQVFSGFGCTGGNVSPALEWTGAPEGTKSFAVTVYDPDAPTGSGWWHWVVFDIPIATTSLPEGAGSADGEKLPAGSRQGPTDFGMSAYGGPCPPSGAKPHRYVFTVYALKTDKLEVPDGATSAVVRFMIHANALATATLTAKYGRK